MCRSKSTETVRLDHLSLEEDAIGVTFFKTKSDQEGKKTIAPRHCYSNPMKPTTCVFLALALYLACHPQLKSGKLFPGGRQRDRFGKCLSKMLGFKVTKKGKRKSKAIGTHSIRKGAATYACGGCTGGPSIVSVCLRCGWSLGNVMERYFRYESAGDQYLGRVMAGLPLNKSDFAVLPAHFSNNNDPIVKGAIGAVFPGLANDEQLQGVLAYCLAALVHHHDLFTTKMPNHPLMSTVLFTHGSMYNLLTPLVNISFESDVIKATGIPPHVELYRQLTKNHNAIVALPNQVAERVKEVIEEKGVAAGNITKDLLQTMLDNSLQNFASSARLIQQPSEIAVEEQRSWSRFDWGGAFHFLPQDFEFPKVELLTAWRLWWLGNQRLKYIPYKQIKNVDLSNKSRRVLTDWRWLMNHMTKCAEDSIQKKIKKPTVEEIHNLFPHATKCLESLKCHTVHNRPRRWEQLTVLTVVKLYRELLGPSFSRPVNSRRKRKRGDDPEADII